MAEEIASSPSRGIRQTAPLRASVCGDLRQLARTVNDVGRKDRGAQQRRPNGVGCAHRREAACDSRSLHTDRCAQGTPRILHSSRRVVSTNESANCSRKLFRRSRGHGLRCTPCGPAEDQASSPGARPPMRLCITNQMDDSRCLPVDCRFAAEFSRFWFLGCNSPHLSCPDCGKCSWLVNRLNRHFSSPRWSI
jgi:hypothetical protein